MSNSFPDLKKWNDSEDINSHLCRICFTLNDLLIPIFEGEGVEQELCQKLTKHLPIKILPSDTLPQNICYPCAKTLIAWDSLYTVCLKTDEILQSLLKEGAKCPSNKRDLENESVMPPKKRKLMDDKEKGTNNIKSPSKIRKTKPKVHVSKKIKKIKIEEDESTMNEKTDTEKKESGVSEIPSNSLKEENILTAIKTEQDLEEDKIPNDKLIISETLEPCNIKCEFCEKSYKSKKCLNTHLKKCHEDSKVVKPQKCSLCSNIYKTKLNLEKHYLKEHLTDQVQCPVCHSSFNSKKLDLHLKSVHGVKMESESEEKFKCKMCDKWFKNKYVRNSHMKETHLSEIMKCKLCDFEGVRTVLRRHKRDVHAEKKFMCSLCPGAFKTLHTLKMHMTSHSDIRCYTCDICGMGFKRLNNVRDHMKCHEKKSNQCQICGNFFARKRYLAIHEKTIHNFYADGIEPEEKGFECGICGAKLKWKKNLLAHMRIHTGEKPYVCKICNKDFICHGSLRTHMAKHSVCTQNDAESQNQVSVSVYNIKINPEQA